MAPLGWRALGSDIKGVNAVPIDSLTPMKILSSVSPETSRCRPASALTPSEFALNRKGFRSSRRASAAPRHLFDAVGDALLSCLSDTTVPKGEQ